MKRTLLPAIAVLALSLLVAVGSQTFLGACAHDDGTFGACHWADRAILGESILLAVLALLALAIKRERAGLYLAMIPASLLGLLTPGVLIALCKAPTMRCRMIMQPAMTILFGVALLLSFVGWPLSRKEEK